MTRENVAMESEHKMPDNIPEEAKNFKLHCHASYAECGGGSMVETTKGLDHDCGV